MQSSDHSFFDALRAGTLTFAYGIPPSAFVALSLGIVALVWLGYANTTRPLTTRWRAGLVALRAAVLVLIMFCLLRPVVIDLEVIPQETFFAVLVDNSASMTITDMPNGQTRKQAAAESLERAGLLDALAEDYQLRFFGFGGETRRANDLASIGTGFDVEDGAVAFSKTGLGDALSYVDDQLGGLPLGGVLLISDGADNSGKDATIAARTFAASGVPVYTLGVGMPSLPRDLGIEGVVTTRTVLEGSVFTAQIRLVQAGFDNERVRLRIVDGEREVASREVVLAPGNVTQRFEIELSPEREEAIVYQLEAELVDRDSVKEEIVSENNRYQFLVDNLPKPALDILFIEGHPRNEYKFIQRAVRGDKSLRLATYLRTGPEKFYRQGIESPTELSDGFPSDREALFDYEAIILGDIEQEFFDTEQLEMLDEFVGERGGGLLLSGRVDEGFIGTPLAAIAPVSLVEEALLPQPLQGGIRRGDHPAGALFNPQLTAAGRVSPLLRLAADEAANINLWAQMPPLQGVYVTGRVKPGASVLLEHPSLDYQNQPLPVLVTQRYGSGRSMSVATASTWRWQMMLPVADQSQEKLWRQLLRWLAVNAKERITLSFDREFYNVGDTVRVEATVLDADYLADNDATLWIQREDPLGDVSDTPMQWQLEDEGVYRAEFLANNVGVNSLLVDVASAAGEGRAENSEANASIIVTPSLREYSNAGLDAGMLQRIAETTGGYYASIDNSSSVAAAIRNTPNAYSKEVTTDLWDSPWLLGLLILMLCLDWTLRRGKGLS